MTNALPPELAALLDATTSEAKRRGHERVTPAHLGPVLLATASAQVAGELPPDTVAALEAYLATLPRTFGTPVADDATLALLRSCADRADPVRAVAVALRGETGALTNPGGSGTADTAAPGPDSGNAGRGPAVADSPAADVSSPHSQSTPTPTPTSPAAPPQDSAPPPPPVGGPVDGVPTPPAGGAPVIPVPERTGGGPRPFALPSGLAGLAEVVPTERPVVPRTDVVRRLLALLGAREPQVPLLVAPQGQGRTGVSRCLAAELADPAHPGPLAGMPVVRVRAEGAITRGRGDAVQRVIEACRGSAIVFVDDVEVLGALGGSGADVGTIAVLRGALHDPDLRVVLTVAGEFIDRLQVVDRELLDEVDRVDLPPLTAEEVMAVARDTALRLAGHHRVTIPDEVVAAATAPPRQIDTTGHPALAVSRLDRAAAAASLAPDRVAQIADLGTAVAGQQYLAFDPDAAAARLRTSVLGQDAAIEAVTNRLAVTRVALDLRPERPDGVFLFAGPTGTGKTELALSLAAEVFGTSEAIVRLDMSEFADDMSISKLIGSAPGYVGSTEPESWLTTKIRRRPQCVLLLDEIEKAHPLVWNTFLQVFDAGRLTDSQGRVADFRDVIVVMTTNIGASAFEVRNTTGFLPSADAPERDAAQVMTQLKQRMRPELLNRLDEILVFRPLQPDVVRLIVDKNLAAALVRLADRGWQVTVGEGVPEFLAGKGYSREYGARPLLRVLESRLLNRVARLPHGPVTVSVTPDGTDLVATPTPQSVQLLS